MHFRTPPIVIDDSSWKNAAESFTVALTLTLGGYESAIVPNQVHILIIVGAFSPFVSYSIYLHQFIFNNL